MKVAHRGKLVETAWFEGKGVLRSPTAVRLGFLHVNAIEDFDQPECSRGIFLLDVWLETKRFQERFAEADVGQPGFVEINAQGEVVKVWPFAAVVSGRHVLTGV